MRDLDADHDQDAVDDDEDDMVFEPLRDVPLYRSWSFFNAFDPPPLLNNVKKTHRLVERDIPKRESLAQAARTTISSSSSSTSS